MPISCVNTANESFTKTGVFVIHDVLKLPKSESDILVAQNIRSMFQFGIMENGKPIGFIGFDDCLNNRFSSDDEIEELKLICNIFATFLTKQRAAEKAQSNFEVMLSIFNNFEGYTYVVDSDDYTVLFENDNVRKVVGAPSIGEPCFKNYMGKDAPCEECPISGLTDKITRNMVEIDNKSYGIYSRTTASKIAWIDGKQNYLISSIDVSQYK